MQIERFLNQEERNKQYEDWLRTICGAMNKVLDSIPNTSVKEIKKDLEKVNFNISTRLQDIEGDSHEKE